MEEITRILLYTLIASACIPFGGLLASVERIRPNWLENEFRRFLIAFGGGVLFSAVAFVLVPEGNQYFPGPVLGVIILLSGGISFFLLERFLGAKKREAAIQRHAAGLHSGNAGPGGAFALGAKSAPLLAAFIGLQNLPEGFNAYRELITKPHTGKKRIWVLCSCWYHWARLWLSLAGPF